MYLTRSFKCLSESCMIKWTISFPVGYFPAFHVRSPSLVSTITSTNVCSSVHPLVDSMITFLRFTDSVVISINISSHAIFDTFSFRTTNTFTRNKVIFPVRIVTDTVFNTSIDVKFGSHTACFSTVFVAPFLIITFRVLEFISVFSWARTTNVSKTFNVKYIPFGISFTSTPVFSFPLVWFHAFSTVTVVCAFKTSHTSCTIFLTITMTST